MLSPSRSILNRIDHIPEPMSKSNTFAMTVLLYF